MVDTIYIESSVASHPRARAICERFSKATTISCERYTEVFNPKAQNFRLQKQNPSLILAEKYKNHVLDAPPGYNVGSKRNYYFSHMLNCIYDCRYCFLQGMYQSANYVVFVNFEDYGQEIQRIAKQYDAEEVHFFSGYDGDSLAYEPVTGFAEYMLTVFQSIPNAWIELRTKSTQIRSLLDRNPITNCIVAFSFTPDEISRTLEHKVPTLNKRLDAMLQLQRSGWTLGLRFDPLIYQDRCNDQYARLFETIFAKLSIDSIHSVSLGAFRLPEKFFKKMKKLYPDEKLFAHPMELNHKMVSYPSSMESELVSSCTDMLLQYVPSDKLFPCTP